MFIALIVAERLFPLLLKIKTLLIYQEMTPKTVAIPAYRILMQF